MKVDMLYLNHLLNGGFEAMIARAPDGFADWPLSRVEMFKRDVERANRAYTTVLKNPDKSTAFYHAACQVGFYYGGKEISHVD